MNFITTTPELLAKSECDEIIGLYLNNAEIFSKRKTYNLDSAIKDICLSHLEDPYWESLINKIKPKVDKEIENYLKLTGTSSIHDYFFGTLFIMHCLENFSIPPHYDFEVTLVEDEEKIRRFTALIYLNGDFDGGELVFPVQNKVIKPEPGLLTIFPTSFIYPHLTIPTFGNDRYVLRMSYYLNNS